MRATHMIHMPYLKLLSSLYEKPGSIGASFACHREETYPPFWVPPYFERKQKDGFAKGRFLANVPSLTLFVPSFRLFVPSFGFLYRRSVFCTLVPAFGVPGASAKKKHPFGNHPSLRTPEHFKVPESSQHFKSDKLKYLRIASETQHPEPPPSKEPLTPQSLYIFGGKKE